MESGSPRPDPPWPIWDAILALSREVVLACDAAGTIIWADPRSARLLGARPSIAFVRLVALGSEDKARQFLELAYAGETGSWELMLVADGRPLAMLWRGAPAAGGAVLVGSLVPDAARQALNCRRASARSTAQSGR